MEPKYIDIHTHVQFSAFDSDRDEVISRALDSGVAMINVGTKKSMSENAVALAEKYKTGVYATIGLHPIHTSECFHDESELGEEGIHPNSLEESFDVLAFEKLLLSPKVVGIGECGLDYFHSEKDTIKLQKEAFEAQISFAEKFNKPLMLHVRNGKAGENAYADVLEMLKGRNVKGNVHFFAGGISDARAFLDIGFTLSFTGVITFAKQYEELVSYVPLDRMHAETDAPYVSPAPHRGRRNEPVFVIEVVKKIAEIKDRPIEEVSEALRYNAKNLFAV